MGLTLLGGLSGLFLLGTCGAGERHGASTPPRRASAPAATPFVDATAASGIAYRVGYTPPSFIRRDLRGLLTSQVLYMTIGGAAAGDCDNDGDVDLFITYGNTGGPDDGGGPNRLYLNQLAERGKGLEFEDHAAEAGVANTRPDGNNDRHSGPAFADMDGDGDLDLFLGGLHGDPSKIYENLGDCTFKDVTANSPDIVHMLATQTISASFGDYDLDGDLDMFLTHWGTLDELYGNPPTAQTDHLWRNESDASGIRFVNVSDETGISKLTRLTHASDFHGQPQIGDFTFTASFARLDGDLWPDIAIAADFGTTQIAINRGDGTFRNLDNPILRATQFGMGSALGDIDNDGDLDWFVTSILGPGDESIHLQPWGNRLYSNDGGAALIVDDTKRAGVADGSFGWAACFLDIDNDGDLDIFHTNGYPVTFLTPRDDYRSDASRAFVRNAAGTYSDQAQALGLAGRTSGRGVVCADFDNDGDIDILELTDAPGNSARLWENRSAAAGRHFLRVKLEGLPPNTEAAGARVFARIGRTEQMREIRIGSNYISQNPAVQVFGLGSSKTVDELRVEWPAIESSAGPVQPPPTILHAVAARKPGRTLSIRQKGLRAH
ncbi:MAG TPA: CRTAC1 family protein [Gammaproteobacteria bacterium]|nr:CRTAC1 family protein [Gammaproteobacteria bacterium]